MSLNLEKSKPSIDPLLFDDICPVFDNQLPTEEEKILYAKVDLTLCIYFGFKEVGV